MKLPCKKCPLGATRQPCVYTPEAFSQLRQAQDWEGSETLTRCLSLRYAGGVVKDSLTTLDSYSLLKAKIEGYWDQLSHVNCPPALALFVDGEEIKRKNRRYTHDFGDRCIQSLAGIVRQIIRQSDLMGQPDDADKYGARRGGDEFVALLFGITSRQVAEERSAVIRARCAEGVKITAPDGGLVHLTASVGAAYIEQPQSPKDLFWALSLADLALGGYKESDRQGPQPELVIAGAAPAGFRY